MVFRTKRNLKAILLALASAPLFFANDIIASQNLPTTCDTNPLDPTSSTNGTGYHLWKSSLIPGQFSGNIYIPTASDACKGIAFHWKIDKEAAKIHIAVAVKDAGWSAIGFSETGGMKGADIVYYESSSGELVDAHVGDGYRRPTTDQYQDWKLNNGQLTDDGYLIFEAERALVTQAGHEDHEIVDDSSLYIVDHQIIGAWSDAGSLSFHGNNVVRTSVQLFLNDELKAGGGLSIFRNEMTERASGSALLNINGYKIPQDKTTYHRICFTMADLIGSGLLKDESTPTNIIGMEFLVDPAAVKYAHHIVMYGHLGDGCSGYSFASLAAWTPGNDFMQFPEGLGLEIGNSPNRYDTFTSILLEYHFDNSAGDANKVDNGSGIKLYYTDETIEHEVGMVVMGDGKLATLNLQIGRGKSEHKFISSSRCTRDFDVDEVTILSEAHHMHGKGKRLVSEVYRDDIIVNTATVDYWDFEQVSYYHAIYSCNCFIIVAMRCVS